VPPRSWWVGGEKVRGAILISGGIPGSQMPFEFTDAMYIPARTAAAFFHRKLPAELLKDREATLKEVNEWLTTTYLPALTHREALSEADRTRIVADLARYTGVRPDQISSKTLVMTNRDYLHGLFAGDPSKVLNTYDMRISGTEHEEPARKGFISNYLREELGYSTDLAYTDLESGYMPSPGPARRSTGERWVYDHTDVTPDLLARMQAGGGATEFAALAAERHADRSSPCGSLSRPAVMTRSICARVTCAWRRNWRTIYRAASAIIVMKADT